MKIFLIHNAVYLPISQMGDKSSQKYLGSSISGDVFMDQIYTEEELRTKYRRNPDFKEVNGFLDLATTYNKH